MKKLLALPITILLAVSSLALASPAHAADGYGGLTLPPGAVEVKGTGNGFDTNWNNVFDFSNGASDVAFWHFVDSGTDSSTQPTATEMVLLFNCGGSESTFTWTRSMGFSTNNGGNNPGWVVMTAMDCTLLDGYVDAAINQFNLSGYVKVPGYREPALGALKVTADATLSYKVTTTQPVWQKTIQPVWQKTIQPVWQKTIQPVWQKTIQPWDAPAYEKKISTGGPDTLVTRLTYSGTDAKATPANGYVFKNGHTVVTLDMAKATSADGQWLTIADSSYNSNGKKTPSQYNNPINYQYNVKIVNGVLTISFDNRLISASVGAYAVCSLVKNTKGAIDVDASFPGNAPKHYANGVKLTLPAGCAQVYLYTHFEGGSLSWYTTGKYEFVGYRWVRDDVTNDAWLRDDVTKDAWLRDDVTNDAWLRDDVTKDAWLRDDVTVTTETEAYEGTFTVTVTDASNAVVSTCKGTLAECGTVTGLKPGAYKVTLSADDPYVGEFSQDVTVVAGKTVTVDFGAVTVTGPAQTKVLDKIYADPIVLAKIYADPIVLAKIYADPIVLDKIYADPVKLPVKHLGDDSASCLVAKGACDYAIYLN